MPHILSSIKSKTLILFSLLTWLCTFSYGQSYEEAIKTDTLSKVQTEQILPSRFRVGAQIGYGCRVGPICRYINPVFRNMAKYRSNVSFGADISYYLKNDIGFGIKYNGIYTSSSVNYELPIIGAGKLYQKIDIHYFGAFFGARYFLKQSKYCIFVNAGAGNIRFRDRIRTPKEEAKVTGSSAAFFGEIGLDFFVTEYFAVGLQVSLCAGALGAVSFSSKDLTIAGKVDNSLRENLTHIDISVGFRFYY